MANKNIKLKKFYDKVYHKGEEKHFTNLVTTRNFSEEYSQVAKEDSWLGKKVLDVGCGTGFFAFHVAKKGGMVLGIDYSKEAIKIAKSRFKHPNLTYKVADISKSINEKFDVVVSIGTLEHMDNPLLILKKFKKLLNKNGKIIITSPNWVNPRGFMLLTLYFLFNAPITLADLHYLTPIEFEKWAKKLHMKIKWRTIDRSWSHGKILIKDFKRRLPNVLSDSELPVSKKGINGLLKWLNSYVLPLNNDLPHSGATGLYTFYFDPK